MIDDDKNSNYGMIVNHKRRLFSSLCGEMLFGITSKDLPKSKGSEEISGWVMAYFPSIGYSFAFFLSGLRNNLSRERMGASMRQERQVASRILQKISDITI